MIHYLSTHTPKFSQEFFLSIEFSVQIEKDKKIAYARRLSAHAVMRIYAKDL